MTNHVHSFKKEKKRDSTAYEFWCNNCGSCVKCDSTLSSLVDERFDDLIKEVLKREFEMKFTQDCEKDFANNVVESVLDS